MLFRHWYQLLFRSVHVFDSTQSSDSCFGYFRSHSDDTAKCKTPFHGSFLGLQAPCHFVRHSPSFMAAILSSISFWIWWRQRSKNTKFQKVAKKRNPYKSCLKINETGEKNREPEVVALQNDSRYQKCYSIWNHTFLLKGHWVGYNIHIMKKVVTLQNDDRF